MILDAFQPEKISNHDVCVVGAGPVGISLALELARLGSRVLLLEAGKADTCQPASEPTYLTATEQNAPFSATTRVGLGGTSASWGSGCTPYDPLDFATRPHVPYSGNPVRYAEIAPYHEKASNYLGCSNRFTIDHPSQQQSVRFDEVIAYASQQNIAEANRAELERAENIFVFTETEVLRLLPTPGTQAIEALELRCQEQTYRLKSPKIVLACGGIGSTRLLLELQAEHPGFLHGEDGALGRYYMGHLSGQIARIAFDDKVQTQDFCFQQDDARAYYRRRITFSEAFLEENALQNIYFLPTNFPLADAGMCSPVLSALHLGLTARHLTPHYMKHYLPDYSKNPLSPPFSFGKHMRNVLRDPVDMLRGLTDVIRQRSARDTGRPPGFHHNSKSRIFALGYHCEQAPNPNSRVTLSERRDSDGRRLPLADLQFSDRDFASVEESHKLLDAEIRAGGIAKLSYMLGLDKIEAHIRSQAIDGYHQIGLTRMSQGSKTGVVDPDLKVHGLDNLWVSSTGILPTSGQAHPTFCAVAFAMRLAKHLAA